MPNEQACVERLETYLLLAEFYNWVLYGQK